mgnify:FL=1
MSQSDETVRSQAESLTHLMDPEKLSRRFWQPEELGEILAHQLRARLKTDLPNLPELSPRPIEDSEAEAAGGAALPRTFGELLAHPRPPVEWLEAVKQFAKTLRAGGGAVLPEEIATVIYFAAIAAALARLGRRITSMDDASLRYSLDWALGQPWLDPATRALLEEGRRLLSEK